ncbi:MAG: RNA-splicing factor [Trizodia sp. TS-e1964]|nr:MAG: RNA-splicing factor [Trizodia sp. TS-e1964]
MEAAAIEEPVFKKRSAKSKSSVRKRLATPPPQDFDSDSADYSSANDESGLRVKRRRKNIATVTASSGAGATSNTDELTASTFTGDRSKTIEISNEATKRSNWYEEEAQDALRSQNLLGTTRPRAEAPEAQDSYKGAANYQKFIAKNPNAPSRQAGPIKAPTNIRTITVTDFAPDVCKDYKQTGFCGFGDSCKFLHAREDYKQGWELDKDWEIGTKGKKISGKTIASANRSATNADEDDENDDDSKLENIPFACIICKKSYTNPIITSCGHYFCEACALKRYRRNPSCAACGSGTGGVFNGAKNLRKMLEKKRERARKLKEKQKEEGLEVSSDDEDSEEPTSEVPTAI